MTFLLFLSVAYIAISFLKDMIFLLPLQILQYEGFVENMVSIFDLAFIPLVGAFFIEATRPGSITNRRLAAAFLPFWGLLLLYGVLHADWVLTGTFVLSALTAIFVLVAVPVNVVRYNRYLSANYSYTKNIGVGWCTGCAFGLFLLLVFYEVCFYKPTWFAEALYDTSFVVVWNIVCLKSRHHQVVTDMITFDNGTSETASGVAAAPQSAATDTAPDKTKEEETTAAEETAQQCAGNGQQADDEARADNRQPELAQPEQTQFANDSGLPKEAFIASALLRCMEDDKMYLNSRLSLSDLAVAAGTNKTYISIYINSQGYTFYDFINKYRVEEACRIIEQMATGERLTMTDVAALSGFNSVSSFNRYFFKIKGITPTAYSRSL